MNTDLMSPARAALTTTFGFQQFRAGQERAVRAIISGRDALVVLPTGSGKSVCYQVPALVLKGLTVVVSPLISLMKDQVDSLTRRGVAAACINSTMSASELSDNVARACTGTLRILYVAPERFASGDLAARLRRAGVALLAVDEAHCISEWGHEFRPSYRRLARVRVELGSPVTVALTATATPEVRRDIASQLHLRRPEEVVTGFDRKNLHYCVLQAHRESERERTLVELVRREPGTSIVYAPTRRQVERLARVLRSARMSCAKYHAGLPDPARAEAQDSFMRGTVKALVATNAFGMGVDKPDVRLVVHGGMPGTLEAYYQEAGRAGRDGNPSRCVLLHAHKDRLTHEFFIQNTVPDRSLVERVLNTVLVEYGASRAPVSDTRLAAMLAGEPHARAVPAARDFLVNAGALALVGAPQGLVKLRLLATARRIRAELHAESTETGVLRTLWKRYAHSLYAGVETSLDELPPGLGPAVTAQIVLDQLQQRQVLMWEPVGGGVIPANTGRRTLDWTTLERRHASELQKLESMQRYAYARGCRRSLLLRYFGDRSAPARCTGCDNCTRHRSL